MAKAILFGYGFLLAICLVLIIYLIIKRIKSKKLENFEKRDN